MRHILAVLAFLAVVPAHAQDISAQLAEIAGKDPVKAAVAAEAALSSPSATSRSLALEATLKSIDGRVRAIGYSYLVGTQKLFLIEPIIPPNAQFKPNELLTYARDASPMRIRIDSFERDLGQFEAMIANPNRDARGTIARDGITILFGWNNAACAIRLNAVEAEHLTGTLKCDANTIRVKSVLP